MKMVARGPQDGAKLVELFGGVRKKKVFLYFSSGTRLIKWLKVNDVDDGDDNGDGNDDDLIMVKILAIVPISITGWKIRLATACKKSRKGLEKGKKAQCVSNRCKESFKQKNILRLGAL